MFIRWQSRKRRRPAFGHRERPKQDVHWKAVLAESARVNGKPLQRHLAVLGGITDTAIEITAQRCHFWDSVIERLERLGNQITADDRQRIELQVANKVPRPTPDEYKAEARRSAQMWGWKYLTEPQRAALQDEAAQWRNGQGQLVTELQSLRGAATSPPACSFCGKTADQVETMVASNAAYICNECVERAISAIAERKAGSTA